MADLLQRKIGIDDCGDTGLQPFIQTGKEARIHKGIVHLGSQIINNQEFTGVDEIIGGRVAVFTVKSVLGQNLKEPVCRKI